MLIPKPLPAGLSPSHGGEEGAFFRGYPPNPLQVDPLYVSIVFPFLSVSLLLPFRLDPFSCQHRAAPSSIPPEAAGEGMPVLGLGLPGAEREGKSLPCFPLSQQDTAA